MELFAQIPVEEVTVHDIAGAVGMTPAAVYYHFASKDQILIEGVQDLREQFVEAVRAHLARSDRDGGLGSLAEGMLVWAASRRPLSTVYFVRSIGLNQTVEALRRETRVELVDLLTAAVRAGPDRPDRAEAGVIAVAVVSLLETSLAAMLNRDVAYRQIGARRFGAEVAAIGDRIAGRS